MSRLYKDRIAKDSGWSLGWGVVNPACGCLIGMAYLWRLKLGFVLDLFCSEHRGIVDRLQQETKAIAENAEGEHVTIIGPGNPLHTKVVEELKKGGARASEHRNGRPR